MAGYGYRALEDLVEDAAKEEVPEHTRLMLAGMYHLAQELVALREKIDEAASKISTQLKSANEHLEMLEMKD